MAKFRIQNINEITEGRELLEAKPHKFTSWFIYISITMLIAFLLWAWFSTKEVIVNAAGIVQPVDKIYNISTLLSGSVQSINFKNGQYVKKGDVILTLNVDNAKKQLNALEQEKNNLSRNIDDLNNLINAIKGDSNFNENKNKYYSEYNSYISQKEILDSEISSVNVQRNSIQKQINALENLQKSIQDNTNYVSDNPLYNSEYQEYYNSKTNLKNKLNSLKNSYNTIQNEQQKENELQNTLQNDMNNLSNTEKEKQIYTKKMEDDISTSIGKAQIQSEINAINQNNKKVDAQNSLSKTEQEIQNESNNANYNNELNSLNSQIESTKAQINNIPNNYIVQINTELQNLNNELNSLNENNTKTKLSKSLTKWQLLSQINSTLDLDKTKLITLNNNLSELSSNVNDGEIKANESGIIYMPQTPQIGMVLRAGEQIAEIMPNNNEFKVKMIIPNDEIGNIKKGDKIKYSFLSFPYTEYGFLSGTLDSINVTSELNPKTGLSYYEAIGFLNSSVIKNKEGKKGTIKLGMACEGKIVSRKEKMLYYILNQLGLKTNNF